MGASVTEPVSIPQAAFAGPQFWQRLNRLANDAGHEGHPRALTDQAEPTNVYRLRCERCSVSVVEIVVDRSPQ